MKKVLCYIAFVLVAFPLLLISCSGKEHVEAKAERSLGKYVYLDDNKVYHCNSNCVNLKYGIDRRNGHEIYAKQPIDTAEFYFADKRYFRVCSQCVDDRIYEQLVGISGRNTTAHPVEKITIDWAE